MSNNGLSVEVCDTPYGEVVTATIAERLMGSDGERYKEVWKDLQVVMEAELPPDVWKRRQERKNHIRFNIKKDNKAGVVL